MTNGQTAIQYDVIIIGCGPAGLSSAIYTSRAQLKTLVIGDHTKGNLYKSHSIANYFGFTQPISGQELSNLGVQQAKNFGTEIVNSEVVDISLNEDQSFTVKDNNQKQYNGKTIIIATGQSFALSGIKNEKELTGKGVSYCVNCDGFFYRNKNVAVIGSGDYAAEEALELLNYTKNVKVLSHGKPFTINPENQEQLKNNNIEILETPRISEFQGIEKVQSIAFTSEKENLNIDGVFMAIGVAGATAFAKKLGLETNNNYIKIDQEGKTNIQGLYAAGDCTGISAQVAVSVGQGCTAALSAIKYIRGVPVYIQYN